MKVEFKWGTTKAIFVRLLPENDGECALLIAMSHMRDQKATVNAATGVMEIVFSDGHK